MRQLAADNPAASPAEVSDAYDTLIYKRQNAQAVAAAALPALVKSVGLSDQEYLSKASDAGDADIVYNYIMAASDVAHPRVQDRLQAKYPTIKVAAHDNIENIISAVELKWFLFKNHGLYKASVTTPAGAREGITHILQMLASGPERVAASAALELPQVATMALGPDLADGWVQDKVAMWRRFGATLVPPQQGGGGNFNLIRTNDMIASTCKHPAPGCKLFGCMGVDNPNKVCIAMDAAPVDNNYWNSANKRANKATIERVREATGQDAAKVKAFSFGSGKGGKGGKGRGRGGGDGGRGRGGQNMGFFGMMLGSAALSTVVTASADPRDADASDLLDAPSAAQPTPAGGATHMMLAGGFATATKDSLSSSGSSDDGSAKKYAGAKPATPFKIKTTLTPTEPAKEAHDADDEVTVRPAKAHPASERSPEAKDGETAEAREERRARDAHKYMVTDRKAPSDKKRARSEPPAEAAVTGMHATIALLVVLVVVLSAHAAGITTTTSWGSLTSAARATVELTSGVAVTTLGAVQGALGGATRSYRQFSGTAHSDEAEKMTHDIEMARLQAQLTGMRADQMEHEARLLRANTEAARASHELSAVPTAATTPPPSQHAESDGSTTDDESVPDLDTVCDESSDDEGASLPLPRGGTWQGPLNCESCDESDDDADETPEIAAARAELDRLIQKRREPTPSTTAGDEDEPPSDDSYLMPLIGAEKDADKDLPLLVLFSGDHLLQNDSVAIQARARGGRADEWDKTNGMQFDLTVQANRQRVRDQIANRRVRGVHMAVPCNTITVLGTQYRNEDEPLGIEEILKADPEAAARVAVGNVLAGFAFEVLQLCISVQISVTWEMPAYRGDKTRAPKRAYWAEKAGYVNWLFWPGMRDLMQKHDIGLARFPGCAVGMDEQKYFDVIAWPPPAYRAFRHLDAIECFHPSHKKTADNSKKLSGVYSTVMCKLVVDAHFWPATILSDEADISTLQLYHDSNDVETIVAMIDSGATDNFFPSDKWCLPGTDAPPTTGRVTLGKKHVVLDVEKSCTFAFSPVNSDLISMVPVNIAPDVPFPVLSLGLLNEMLHATFVYKPYGDWSWTLTNGARFRIVPGFVKQSRLGFTTVRVRHDATVLMMWGTTLTGNGSGDVFANETLAAPTPVWLESNGTDELVATRPDNEGYLMLSAGVTAHVHMPKPQYTESELLNLLHVRSGHAPISTIIANSVKGLVVGNDMSKITSKTINEFAKKGCPICNMVFKQAVQKGTVAEPRPDKLPLMMMDSFGKVKVPSVYHGYVYANTAVLAQGGFLYTEGAKALSTEVMIQVSDAFRAMLRPHIGEVAAVRTDMISITTTAKRWKEYARGPQPIASEHSTAGKHHQIGQIEVVHKTAWPMVLADLVTQRRSLKWWWVCWRHAILRINVNATRRDDVVSSRYYNIFKHAFNESNMRCILSPCQYYVDKAERSKPDPKMRNGLWCGISPENVGAAWVWQGSTFVTVEHGDLKTNEWVAWALPAVGTVSKDLMDADGDLDLFTDETTHHRFELYEVDVKAAEAERGQQQLPVQNDAAQIEAARGAVQAAQAAVQQATNSLMLLTENDASEIALKAELELAPTPSVPVTTELPPGQSTIPFAARHREAHAALHNKAKRASRMEVGSITEDLLAHVGTAPDMAKAFALEAAHQAIEAYEGIVEPHEELIKEIYGAFNLIVSNEEAARTVVTGLLDKLDAAADKGTEGYLTGDEEAFAAALEEQGVTPLAMLIGHDRDGGKHMVAAGFLGKMVRVYDDAGGTYDIDEPESWSEYLVSQWKDDWTQAIIKEVSRLEDMHTWKRVPRSWAAGHPVHKSKVLFKAKLTEHKKLDRRKARVIIVGRRAIFQQGRDYLEHFAAGCSFATIRLVACLVHSRTHFGQSVPRALQPGEQPSKWVKFRYDVTNAFPHEAIERKIFMELPRGPFDWTDPLTGEEQVGLLEQNLYGTPPGPRTFVEGVHAHFTANGMRSCSVERALYTRDSDGKVVIVATYVDEGWGGATNMDTALWFKAMLEKKYAITWSWMWDNTLGFGVEADEGKPLAFSTNKYVRDMVDEFLQGESKPTRNSASRDTIMTLPAEKLPELGSPEDVAMRGMQANARSLAGKLGHLARGRVDMTLDHALCAQVISRASHSAYAHLLEILRFVWANEDTKLIFPGTIVEHWRHEPGPYREPIRPYDEEVDYDMYGLGDHSMARVDVPNSKCMGAHAVMFMGGALDWKAYRHHTIITHSTGGETIVASRLGQRLVTERRKLNFLGEPRVGPTNLFTDNDGTWSVSRNASTVTRQMYEINHVRMLQELSDTSEIRAFQCDGDLNPIDAGTKWLEAVHRKRHYAFLQGQPAAARAQWLACARYKSWKPKKIEPVPLPPISVPETAEPSCSES